MATLNRDETKALWDAQSILDSILREGYDPSDDSQSLKRAQIKAARDGVKVVVTMKGKYE